MDTITKCAITKLENLATHYLKSGWGFLEVSQLSCCLLPKHLTGVKRGKIESLILYQSNRRSPAPAVGFTAHLGDEYLQTDYHILFEVHSLLSSLLMARPLYKLSKKLLIANEHSHYENHLDTLSVRCPITRSFLSQTCVSTSPMYALPVILVSS